MKQYKSFKKNQQLYTYCYGGQWANDKSDNNLKKPVKQGIV